MGHNMALGAELRTAPVTGHHDTQAQAGAPGLGRQLLFIYDGAGLAGRMDHHDPGIAPSARDRPATRSRHCSMEHFARMVRRLASRSRRKACCTLHRYRVEALSDEQGRAVDAMEDKQ
jgi:hypothetical protein